MITKPPPGYKRVCDWIGKTVRTTEVLKNGWMEIPIGTVCAVTDARSGLRLCTDPCAHCGVRVYINKVPPHTVEMINSPGPGRKR
jgi:hypothetical protein